MIDDLSRTLRAILQNKELTAAFPELDKALIVFDPPVAGFAPTQPTVNLFLYDIRENMELRSNEPLQTRLINPDAKGDVEIKRPPLRVACSYLITAWSVDAMEPALQEHRLLGQALQVLSSHATIPETFLQGQLRNQVPSLPMLTARSNGLKDPSEFWTALGNKLRPSISVTVTISMEKIEPKADPDPVWLVRKRLIKHVLPLSGKIRIFKIPRQQGFNFFNRIRIRQRLEHLGQIRVGFQSIGFGRLN